MTITWTPEVIAEHLARCSQSDRMSLKSEDLAALLEEVERHRKLLAMQRKRTIEADKRFMQANEVDYLPDLGELVGWLMTQADKANADLAAARQRIAELEAYADKLAAGLPEGMLPKDVEVIKSSNAHMAARIVELEAALKWYADEAHYDEEHAPVVPTLAGWWYDNGAKARKALQPEPPQ